MGLISTGNIQKEITSLISGMIHVVRRMILWKGKAHVSTDPRQEERDGTLEVTAPAEIYHGSIACQYLLPSHRAQNATPATCLCYWDILSRCLTGGPPITSYVLERFRRYLHYWLHQQRQLKVSRWPFYEGRHKECNCSGGWDSTTSFLTSQQYPHLFNFFFFVIMSGKWFLAILCI